MVNQGYSGGRWISPSAATRETTAWAMARAAERWGLELPLQYGINVFGHRDVSKFATACPGDLDVQAVVNRANEILSVSSGARPFVMAAYQDVLNRLPESESVINYWSTRIMTGMSRGEMGSAFNNSDEYRNLKIVEAYQNALNRDPEPAGAAYWMGALRRGQLSPEDLYSTFIHMDEMFYTQGGGTNAGFVTALYRELLGREPESGGLQYWTARLNTGEPRSTISNLIWFSPEKYDVRTNQAFQTFLGRQADPGGLTYWSGVAKSYGPTAMRSMLMGTSDYWNRAQTRFGSQ